MSESKRRDEIAGNLMRLMSEIPSTVRLIVVTKNFPVTDIEILYQLGVRDFGENRVQELASKDEALSPDIASSITWHFQGKIQSNKIPLLNRHADVIHSVDSKKAIDRLSEEKQVFLQINLDPKDGQINLDRSGIEPEEVAAFAPMMLQKFGGNFLGVMAVAPHSPGITAEEIGAAFARLRLVSGEVISIAPFAGAISAGMSNDYSLAISHGATHIRLGSSILGQRH